MSPALLESMGGDANDDLLNGKFMLVDNVRWLCRETCELCWQLRTGEESWDPDALRRSTVVC